MQYILQMVGKVRQRFLNLFLIINFCWMETISCLLNVQTPVITLLDIRWVVKMYTALGFYNILNSLGVFFNCYLRYISQKVSCIIAKNTLTVTRYISQKVSCIIAKNTFSLECRFCFAVLYICSISFYNFFGLAVTKSLTGKGKKNCLTYSYTKGLLALRCAPSTHLYPLCVWSLHQFTTFSSFLFLVACQYVFSLYFSKAQGCWFLKQRVCSLIVCFSGWHITMAKKKSLQN